tara:strand:+ start:3063 stop:3224 length:162 start_codon:yes stop_codon:yes gene_type:complete
MIVKELREKCKEGLDVTAVDKKPLTKCNINGTYRYMPKPTPEWLEIKKAFTLE